MLKRSIGPVLFLIGIVGPILVPKGTLGQEQTIVIGNKNFTEQYIIGEMMKQLLESKGYKVELRPDLSTMALRAGMESGDLQLCAEYTGTAWMIHLQREYKPGTDNTALYRKLRKADKEHGFLWLDPIWNNNTYALASWPSFVHKHNLSSLSDLAALYGKKEGRVETFIDFEFSARPDGWYALKEHYGIEVDRSFLKTGTPGASILSLEQRQVQVAMVFGTDASIAQHDWYLYRDNKSVFPPYDLTPYARQSLLETFPDLPSVLNRLVATFSRGGEPANAEAIAACRKKWQSLNARVDLKRMEAANVARRYLEEHGLLRD